MSADVHDFPTKVTTTNGGDGGADGPTLIARIEKIEAGLNTIEKAALANQSRLQSIEEALKRLEPAIREIAIDGRKQFQDLTVRIASVEGQLRGLPTALQLFVALISTWSVGAAIVFALLKATHP